MSLLLLIVPPKLHGQKLYHPMVIHQSVEIKFTFSSRNEKTKNEGEMYM